MARDYRSGSCNRPPHITRLLADVAEAHNLSLAYMLAKSNEMHLVRARVEAMRRLKDLGLSTTAIGRYLGGMHHSTVVHHLQKAPEEMDYELKEALDALAEQGLIEQVWDLEAGVMRYGVLKPAEVAS